MEDLGLTPHAVFFPMQYVGMGGVTAPCIEAVQDMLQSNRKLSVVRILTEVIEEANEKTGRTKPQARHALIFEAENEQQIAVKSGFSSGYGGEGPSGFSYVLQLLDAHGIDVSETKVAGELLMRLDAGALTYDDVAAIKQTPARPGFPYEYIQERHQHASDSGLLWQRFPHVMPFAILDPRIIPLAITFWSKPNDNLRSAFVLVEDQVRDRTGLQDHGADLFRKAFNPPTAKLHWPGINQREAAARALLFESVFRSHRNPRHHRELNDKLATQLRELLAINHLLCLEAESMPIEQSSTPARPLP